MKSNDESVDASEMTRLLSLNVISRGYRVSGIELYSDCQLVNGKFRRCITADKTGITGPERCQYRRDVEFTRSSVLSNTIQGGYKVPSPHVFYC